MTALAKIRTQKGNFNLGRMKAKDAHRLGKSFVGPGYLPIMRKNKVIGYKSKDGLRQYRFPKKKKNGQAAGSTQANLEVFAKNKSGKYFKIKNAHIDITR